MGLLKYLALSHDKTLTDLFVEAIQDLLKKVRKDIQEITLNKGGKINAKNVICLLGFALFNSFFDYIT